MASRFPVGTRLRTKVEDADLDEHDHGRRIVPGTCGTIVAAFGPDDVLYDIEWDTGAWTRWTEEEIQTDAEVVPAPEPRQCPTCGCDVRQCTCEGGPR